MPEGKLGVPRPFAESYIIIEVHVKRGEPWSTDIEGAEQEIRSMLSKYHRTDVRADIEPGETYTGTTERGTEVEKVSMFQITIDTPEPMLDSMREILEYIEQNFPVDSRHSKVICA